MADQEMNQNTEPTFIVISSPLPCRLSIDQLVKEAAIHGCKVDVLIVDEMCGPGPWDVDFSELERRCLGNEEFREQYLCEWSCNIPEPVQVDEPKKKTRPFAPIPPWDRRFRKR